MYQRILIPVENTPHDRVILDHIRGLAKTCNALLIVLHVADGFVARNYQQLNLRESEEMVKDRAYLEKVCAQLEEDGFEAEPILGGGDPATEIVATAEREKCDLIAMGTHGHKGLQDIIYGSTANEVRHKTFIPVLMVRG